jgi:hypothetical protein
MVGKRWLGWTRAILLLLLLISLLPMMRISFYNHSSVDDFRYGVLTHQAWVETHNVFAVLGKALEQTAITYRNWQGSYAALPLFALQPAIFGEGCYWTSFFILVGLYLLAVFSSLRRVWKAFIPEADKRAADSLAALYCLMTLQLMPVPVEAFYWWNGSVYYFFFHSLFLVQLANLLILHQRREKARKHPGLLLASLVLAVLLSGSNYVTALTTLEMLALLLIYQFLRRHPARGQLLAVFLMGLAGFAVNVLAPGNAGRQAESPQSTPLWAVAHAFIEGWNHIVEWTGVPLLLFFAALFVLLWAVPTTRLFARGWMLPLLTALMLLVYISGFVPSLYAISWKGPGRARATPANRRCTPCSAETPRPMIWSFRIGWKFWKATILTPSCQTSGRMCRRSCSLTMCGTTRPIGEITKCQDISIRKRSSSCRDRPACTAA